MACARPRSRSRPTPCFCLINQASALLRNQIRRLEKDFLEHGGLRERMTRARLENRSKDSPSGRSPLALCAASPCGGEPPESVHTPAVPSGVVKVTPIV